MTGTIATAKIQAIRDAAEEVMEAAEEVLDIRDAPRGDYSPDDRDAAMADLESAYRVLAQEAPESWR